MKLGIFSDVHSNLPALEAILADAEKQKIDELISLGDNIGYGPFPNETMELVWKYCGKIKIVGNHENMIFNLMNKKKK